jgi:hypothetical protein
MKVRDLFYAGVMAGLLGLMGNACNNESYPLYISSEVAIVQEKTLFGDEKRCYVKAMTPVIHSDLNGREYAPGDLLYFINKNELVEIGERFKCPKSGEYSIYAVPRKKKELTAMAQD